MGASNTGLRERVEHHLLSRAREDPEFRRRLLEDPRRVIEQELSTTVVEGVEICVVEETSSRFYLVLPQPGVEEGELSDEDLERVAGGGGKSSTISNVFEAPIGQYINGPDLGLLDPIISGRG